MIRILTIATLGFALAGCSNLPMFGRGGPDRGLYDHPSTAEAAPHDHGVHAGHGGGRRHWILELEATHEGKSSSNYHEGVVVPGALTVEARDYGDTHENARRFALRGSTTVDAKTEVFGAISYTSAEARDHVTVGAVGLEPITAQFEDYEKIGLEVGARRYIDGSAHPGLYSRVLRGFVSGSVGVAQIQAMDATFTSAGFPNLDPTLPATIPAQFYDESVVATAFAGAGVQYALSKRAAIEVETGLRYDGALNDNDTTIGALGIGAINDTDGRFVVPVTVRGRLRF